MQPRYLIGSVEHTVTPLRRGRTMSVEVDGCVVQAHIRPRGTNECDLIVNGVVHRVFHAQHDRRIFLSIGGRLWSMVAVDEFSRNEPSPDLDDGAVVAPMPGVVVSVNVETGQRVAAGETLILIESMKLQCELRARSAGIVRRIAAHVGASFVRGAVLVELDATTGENL